MSSPSGPRAFVCERLLAVPQSVTRQNATLVLPAVLVPFTLSYEQELEEAERRMTRAAIPALGKLLSIAMFAAVAIRFQGYAAGTVPLDYLWMASERELIWPACCRYP